MPRPNIALRMPTRPQKITFGEMREMGVRDVVVYCQDYRCSHNVAMPADRWPDHTRLSDIEPRFICAACGRRGAAYLRSMRMV
jgi:hypothetical protein